MDEHQYHTPTSFNTTDPSKIDGKLEGGVVIDSLYERGITVTGKIHGPYKIIVTFSGGKDSQACLLLALKECNPDEILAIFCDTKFEHPKTYAHVKYISIKYGVDLVTLNAGSVESICTKYKRLPGSGSRHCTDELKIRPSKFFYESLAKSQGGFEVWLGMRSDESKERGERYKGILSTDTYMPNDILNKYPKKLGKLGVRFRLPIIDWATDEIFALLNGDENWLYSQGFSRVGCFPCLAGGEAMQMKAFYFDETGKQHFKIADDIAQSIGRQVLNSKKYYGQGPGCSFCCI